MRVYQSLGASANPLGSRTKPVKPQTTRISIYSYGWKRSAAHLCYIPIQQGQVLTLRLMNIKCHVNRSPSTIMSNPGLLSQISISSSEYHGLGNEGSYRVCSLKQELKDLILDESCRCSIHILSATEPYSAGNVFLEPIMSDRPIQEAIARRQQLLCSLMIADLPTPMAFKRTCYCSPELQTAILRTKLGEVQSYLIVECRF